MRSERLFRLVSLPIAMSVLLTAAPSVLAQGDYIDPNEVTVTEVEAGGNYDVEEGLTVQYFEFTPEHDGYYFFYTISDSGDPVLDLYDLMGCRIANCDDYSDDVEERNAAIVVTLHEGYRFIIAVSSYDDEPLGDYQLGISQFWLEGFITSDNSNTVYNSDCDNPYGDMYETDILKPVYYVADGKVEAGSEARVEVVLHNEDFPEDVRCSWCTWNTNDSVHHMLFDDSSMSQSFTCDFSNDNVETFYEFAAVYEDEFTGEPLELVMTFTIRNDNHLALVDTSPEHYLVTPGRTADFTLNVTCDEEYRLQTGSNNMYYSGGSEGLTVHREPNDQPYHRFHVEDGYNNIVYKDVYIFSYIVEDMIPVTAGQEYSVTAPPSGEVEQRIYSFVPDRSGIYAISSFGLTEGDPYIAVFDSDRNCIGFDDNVNGDPWVIGEDQYMELWTTGTLDRNFYLQCGLLEGETYYIAIPFFSPNFNGSDEFKMKIELVGVATRPDAPSSSTPEADDPTPSVPSSSEPSGASEPVPSSSVPETGVAGFVERLYTVALGRNSDPAGKQDWIEAITLRGETGADCARGFLYSPEFLGKDISNEEFVRVLYRTFFDREPDQAGFNAWVAVLDNGTTKQEVIEGFINSTEWANLCLSFGIRGGGTGSPNITVEPNQQTIDFATRLYTTCLNRQADPDGLMAWARQLANQRDTGTGAARGFFFSEEFLGQNTSNGDYISRLYRTFMGREPDGAGFVAWMNQLESGVSREEVFRGFAESTEFARICASYGIIR